MPVPSCPLCHPQTEVILYQEPALRIILAGDQDYPGLCRVIWQEHVKEMGDLSSTQSQHLLHRVLQTEQAIKRIMCPDKMNLASLGNQVPHLHWHIIPRFVNDKHFPHPIWASPQREAIPHTHPDLRNALSEDLEQQIRRT